MRFNFLATDEKLRSALPLYLFTYATTYNQYKANYKNGAQSHHIILTLSGEGHFEMQGKEFKVKEGDILFYKGDIPCFYEPLGNWTTCFITFCGYGAERLFEYYSFPDCFTIVSDEIAQSIKEICISADKKFGEEKLSSMLYSLVNEIGRLINASTTPHEYEKAVTFIRENFTKDISLDDILKVAETSSSTLYRQFYEQAKTTPIKFINKLRIGVAKLYLESENKTINEIAESVGFSSTNYFIETFKKLEKTTPLQYRKRSKK